MQWCIPLSFSVARWHKVITKMGGLASRSVKGNRKVFYFYFLKTHLTKREMEMSFFSQHAL